MSEFRDVMKKYRISSNDIDHMAAQMYLGDLDDPLDYVSESVKNATKSERRILTDLITHRQRALSTFLYTNFLPD